MGNDLVDNGSVWTIQDGMEELGRRVSGLSEAIKRRGEDGADILGGTEAMDDDLEEAEQDAMERLLRNPPPRATKAYLCWAVRWALGHIMEKRVVRSRHMRRYAREQWPRRPDPRVREMEIIEARDEVAVLRRRLPSEGHARLLGMMLDGVGLGRAAARELGVSRYQLGRMVDDVARVANDIFVQPAVLR